MARTKQTAEGRKLKRQGTVARFDERKPGTSETQQQQTDDAGAGTTTTNAKEVPKETDTLCEQHVKVQNDNQPQTIPSVLSAFEEDLICAICTDQFKHPKFLSCGHTFCQPCLQDMMSQHDEDDEVDIECPTCRVVTDLNTTDYDVDNLPTNLVAQDLVERLEKENKLQKDVKNKCKNHVQEQLVLYCKTCKKAICRECALYVHCRPDHDYVNLGDFVGKLKTDMLNKMHQLVCKDQELKAKLEEYGQFHKDWTFCTSQAELWVSKMAGIVQEKIEKDKRQKLTMIKDKQQFQDMLFKNYRDNFGTILTKIGRNISSRDDLAKIQDLEYLAMHWTLIENVEHLLVQDLPNFDDAAWQCSVEFEPNKDLINCDISLGTVTINKKDTSMLRWGGVKHGVKRPRELDDGNKTGRSSDDSAEEDTSMSLKKQAVETSTGSGQNQQTSSAAEGAHEKETITDDDKQTNNQDQLPKMELPVNNQEQPAKTEPSVNNDEEPAKTDLCVNNQEQPAKIEPSGNNQEQLCVHVNN